MRPFLSTLPYSRLLLKLLWFRSYFLFFSILFFFLLSSCDLGFHIDSLRENPSSRDLHSGNQEGEGPSQEGQKSPSEENLGSNPPGGGVTPDPTSPRGSPPANGGGSLVSSKPTGGRGGPRGRYEGQCSDGRQYIIYAPSSYEESTPLPLVTMMHGAGDTYQNFEQFMAYTGWQALSESKKFLIMVPNHKNPSRPSFLHYNSNGTVNLDLIAKESSDLLECTYRGVGRLYNIETNAIYWMGFSEGAHFSVFAANHQPERIKGIVAYAGYFFRLNNVVIKRKTPLYFIVGSQDRFLDPVNTYSAQWVDNPKKVDVVAASHSFSQLNALVRPSVVWDWLQNTPSEPVQSGF
jgi:predicted esterase